MSMNVTVTGSEGTIGRVACEQLSGSYDVTRVDFAPEVEEKKNGVRMNLAGEYDRLKETVADQHVIVHLAWNLEENYNTGEARVENREMFENVLRAAEETGVKDVILASSIHAIDQNRVFADDPYRSIARGKRDRSTLDDDQWIGFGKRDPGSLYGWCKLLMEYRAEAYASDDLRVTSIRFGGINPDDEPDYPGAHEPVNFYPSVYCSHNDCGRLLRHVIELDTSGLDDNAFRVYGMSNNSRRVHTFENPFCWMPEDDSETRLDSYWDPWTEYPAV